MYLGIRITKQLEKWLNLSTGHLATLRKIEVNALFIRQGNIPCLG